MDLSKLDFKYSPLPGPRSLRLLKIERDTNVDEGGPTYCKMETFLFTDHPKYVALSYTWDDPEGHREDTGEQNHAPLKYSLLFVDGKRFVGIKRNGGLFSSLPRKPSYALPRRCCRVWAI